MADLCHVLYPWKIHEKWSNLITEEMHQQGDEESQNKLPVSPLCQRPEAEDPQKMGANQLGFFNYIARPLFEEAFQFMDSDKSGKLEEILELNYTKWEKMAGSEP